MTDELPIVLLHGSATGSYSWAARRSPVSVFRRMQHGRTRASTSQLR